MSVQPFNGYPNKEPISIEGPLTETYDRLNRRSRESLSTIDIENMCLIKVQLNSNFKDTDIIKLLNIKAKNSWLFILRDMCIKCKNKEKTSIKTTEGDIILNFEILWTQLNYILILLDTFAVGKGFTDVTDLLSDKPTDDLDESSTNLNSFRYDLFDEFIKAITIVIQKDIKGLLNFIPKNDLTAEQLLSWSTIEPYEEIFIQKKNMNYFGFTNIGEVIIPNQNPNETPLPKNDNEVEPTLVKKQSDIDINSENYKIAHIITGKENLSLCGGLRVSNFSELTKHYNYIRTIAKERRKNIQREWRVKTLKEGEKENKIVLRSKKLKEDIEK